MESDLNELHKLANTTFQNITNLTPSLRQLVVNAKVYQKSVQTTCNVAVMFIESLQNIADAATVSEGSTKKLGEVLLDIIDAFKEIENMKLELTKLFINEIIIPLESRAEIEIGNTKVTHKSYNSENKVQTELVDKAKSTVSKYKKKSVRKKKSQKSEDKEKNSVQLLEEAEKKLQQVREEGLRKALIEERRVYCFVAERMCTYGRGMVIYNNRISDFVNQKLPDWQQFISRPTELPPESEDIISNPTGYKMGTVRRKITKRDSVKRGKSFSNHFQTKYSTLDGRSSRGGSRPSLSAAMTSCSNLSTGSSSVTPTRKAPTSPKDAHTSIFPSPPPSVVDQESSRSNAGSPETTPLEVYVPSTDGTVVAASNQNRSEYANLVTLSGGSDAGTARSHSFTVPKRDYGERKASLNRTESSVTNHTKHALAGSTGSDSHEDFTSKLAIIQQQLSQKFNQDHPIDPTSKSRLKAVYAHQAQDASQLDFEKDDIILPICEETSGWQYGESEKTGKSGWFPAAYCEEVLITSTGETQAAGAGAGRHKKPPPVAKKSVRGAAGRKISVACGPLTKPSRSYTQDRHDSDRRNSVGDVPHMTSSSSMPQIVHLVKQDTGSNVTGHERKHSNSFQGLQLAHQDSIDSFEDSNNDESAPTSGENSPRKKSRTRSRGYDSMPPPPPPPPPPEEDDVIIIKTNNIETSDSPFVGLSFKTSITSTS